MVEMNNTVQGTPAVFDPLHAKLISKRRRFTLPQWGVAWLVLIPALIFITMFMLYPIVNTFLYAFIQNFTNVKGGGSFALGQFFKGLAKGRVFTFGLSNFKQVLGNDIFLRSIGNTAILVIVEVPLTITVSLLIATFLNNIKVLKGFYQTVFFLPYVTNTIALGLIFNLAFSNTPGGLVNMFLHDVFGVKDPINWLSDASYAGLPKSTRFTQGVVIVLYSLWNGIAFKILVFMSGLATIDSQYYNAAKIDGASNFTIWRRITLPLLSPQILYITITSFIGAFKMYTGVMAVYQGVGTGTSYFFGTVESLGSGHDGEAWIPIVGWIYKQLHYFPEKPGIPSAASLILLAIIMVITAVQFAVSKKRVHY
jgi:multiple sugar transport system permease protein